MDVHDETHIIDSCCAAGWRNIVAIFLGVANSKGRQLCDEKQLQAPLALVNFKLIVSKMFLKILR